MHSSFPKCTKRQSIKEDHFAMTMPNSSIMISKRALYIYIICVCIYIYIMKSCFPKHNLRTGH